MRYSEKWGDSIDSAVELALQELKLSRDQVTITVLEEPSKGFFGIGTKLAKVRVEEIVKVKESKIVKEKDHKEVTNNQNKKNDKKACNNQVKQENKVDSSLENKKAQKNKKEKENKTESKQFSETFVSDKPDNLVKCDNHIAKEFLEKTFKEMGISVKLELSCNEDSVYIDVEGEDTGTVIGKRGQTLDALQYLTSLVVNKGEDEYIRVILDAENYRAKREDTLRKLALRLAEKVKKTRKTVRLEPMNPYERKVIHSTLQNYKGVYTISEGDEPYRKVVIKPEK